MTGLAILGTDRHVLIERRGKWYTGRVDTVVTVITALCQDRRIGVVYAERRTEALGGMAGSAIGRGRRMCGHR